jgi:outer membrane protein assembly factor BamB
MVWKVDCSGLISMNELVIEGSNWKVFLKKVAPNDSTLVDNVPMLRLGEPAFEASSTFSIAAMVNNQETWKRIITSVGGATGVHAHSAVLINSSIVLAIGPFLVCLNGVNGQVLWHQKCDEATCFGVYFLPEKNALIVHGETEITRLTLKGKVLWKTWGKDIFTGPLTIQEDGVLVTDFNGEIYFINLDTGISTIIGKGIAFPHC